MKLLFEGLGYGYFGGCEGSIMLNKVSFDKVFVDGKCLFYCVDKVICVIELVVVCSCDINFFVYSGLVNSLVQFSSVNLCYLIYDIYSYVGQNFIYILVFSDKGLILQEIGICCVGWLLVCYFVFYLLDVLNIYCVVCDSVEDSQFNLFIILYVFSDYFISMGVSIGGVQ